jgi:hypothetical protein
VIAPRLGKRLALVAAAFVALVSGALLPVAARLGGDDLITGVSLVSGFLGLFALFAWIQYDRRALGLKRSPGFNFALAWAALLTAPWYFVRHRPRGRRWQPLLGLALAATVGWNALLFIGMFTGGIALLAFLGPR